MHGVHPTTKFEPSARPFRARSELIVRPAHIPGPNCGQLRRYVHAVHTRGRYEDRYEAERSTWAASISSAERR